MDRASFEELLWNPPSPESWRLLCEALHALPEDEELDATLARVESAIQHWPYELRATMCGLPWDEQLAQGIPNRKTSIVRYLRYDQLFFGRYGEMISRSPNLKLKHIKAMCASSVTKNLQKINFYLQGLPPHTGAALASSSSLDGLESLDLSANELGEGVVALAAAPWMSHLRELNISSNRCNDAIIEAFLRSSRLTSIEVLALSNSGLTAGIARSFTEEKLPSLRSLDLPNNALQGAGLEALSRSFPLQKLRRLDLSGNDIKSLRQLASLPKELNLSSNLLVPEALPHLLQSAAQPTSLSLRRCNLSEPHFVGVSPSEQIVSLDLSENLSFGAGALSLITKKLPRLGGLYLRSCALAGEDLQRFLKALRELEVLDLSLNKIHKSVIKDLAQQELPLRELFLEKVRLTGPGFGFLATAPWCRSLRKLSLRENKISKVGHVLFSAEMPALEELWLDDVNLDEEGALKLARAPWRPKILHLNNNPIGDAAVCALAASPLLRDVTRLNLNKTKLTDQGAQALASSPYLKQLEVLHIEKNSIGDKGAQLLAECRHWRKILWDDNPNISKIGKAALNSWPRRCCP